MQELIGHNHGPGIAAGVVLMTLMETLTANGALKQGDTARILAIADGKIAAWGAGNMAVQDARRVLDKMRGLGA